MTVNDTFSLATDETPIVSMSLDKNGVACIVTGINVVRVNLITMKRLSKK